MIEQKAPPEQSPPTPEEEARARAEIRAAYKPLLVPHPGRATPVLLEEYRAEGGYQGWEKAVRA